MPQSITVERRGAVGLIVFRRPKAMNAWTRAMRGEIAAACTELDGDTAIRAVVFTGEGDRAFGAGQDLREGFPPAAEVDAWVDEWRSLYTALRSLSKPSIAALNGLAVGSSFQFALMADFRIGHPAIRMGQPEIKAGVASSMGPWVIHALMGQAMAADLSLTGRLMDAAECQARGLLTRLVPQDSVLDTALALAAELSEVAPLAMALTKQRLAVLTEDGFDACFDVWKANLHATIVAAG
jgi:enoyl-CoA hydratase